MGTADEAPGDGDLIRLAQAGDDDAFGQLVTRHMRQAYFAALGLVGSREDALDLSQEAFARAFRARRTIDPDRPFFAWYYAILRRRCFNFLRDRRRRQTRLAEGAAWLVAQTAAQFEDPARAAERREDHRRLVAAMAELPDHEREVLVLRAWKETSDPFGPPMHPAGRRCSSLAYVAYARSSRLGRRAPRHPKWATCFLPGP